MEIFDKTIAVEQAGGSVELAKDLFGMLLNDLPQMRETLNMLYTGKKTQQFWDIAHKIHGATAYCGTPLLKQASKQLENAIKADDTAGMEQGLQEVNTQIDRLLEQADTLLAQL